MQKIVQKPQEYADSSSPEQENNVLFISEELQKLDFNGPLIWFSIIVGLVMLLTFSSSLFNK